MNEPDANIPPMLQFVHFPTLKDYIVYDLNRYSDSLY